VKRVNKPDMIAGAVLLGLAVFVYIETLGFPTKVFLPGVPLAYFFPRIIAGLLGLLSIVLIISGIRAKHEAPQAIEWRGIGRVVVVTVLIIVYIILMPRTSFFILTPFLITPVALVMGERDWKRILATVLLFMLMAYFVFFRLLGMAFPTILF
jgi:hypothetical protein